jgi:hypothetical protein
MVVAAKLPVLAVLAVAVLALTIQQFQMAQQVL